MVLSNGQKEDVGSSDKPAHELWSSKGLTEAKQGRTERGVGNSLLRAGLGESDSASVSLDGDVSHRTGEFSWDRVASFEGSSGLRSRLVKPERDSYGRDAVCLAESDQGLVVVSESSCASAASTGSSNLVTVSADLARTSSARLFYGSLDSLFPVLRTSESCESSALGRAGITGGIDVVSRSGLACQIRSNTLQNSALSGRPSVEGRSPVEQPLPSYGVCQTQDAVSNPNGDSFADQSESFSGAPDASSWVQALSYQRTGACRVDERLRPLLRWNVSCVGADGRLLVQLGQHFKARELNIILRCMCAPLVQLRVGKVLRQGRRLRPTTSRKMFSLEAGLWQGSLLWQSEKSKAAGDELVLKMKDLLSQRPTLSQLTGIEESRLDSFASYIWLTLKSSESETSESPGSDAAAYLRDSIGFESTSASRPLTPQALSPICRESLLSIPSNMTRSIAEAHSCDCVDAPAQDTESIIGASNTSPFLPPGSSPSIWTDSTKRRHIASSSRLFDPVRTSDHLTVNSDGSLTNAHDQPVLLSSSWSTRTTLLGCRSGKRGFSSLSAGLYTSVNTETSGRAHENEHGTITQSPQLDAESSVRSCLLPTFLADSSSGCFGTRPGSSHLPSSSASLITPDQYPWPLETFTSPCISDIREQGLIKSSTSLPSFFSVRPPSRLPPGSLSFHEFSLSPVQLPVSTLVTAAIPIHSSGISPLHPVSSLPLLHKPTPYVVRAPSALSGYGSPTSDGFESSFFSRFRNGEATLDESCSVSLTTTSSPVVPVWHPSSTLSPLTSIFDSYLSLDSTTLCTNTSSLPVMQTQRPFSQGIEQTSNLLGHFRFNSRSEMMFGSRVMAHGSDRPSSAETLSDPGKPGWKEAALTNTVSGDRGVARHVLQSPGSRSAVECHTGESSVDGVESVAGPSHFCVLDAARESQSSDASQTEQGESCD